jgi:hypothetical protein
VPALRRKEERADVIIGAVNAFAANFKDPLTSAMGADKVRQLVDLLGFMKSIVKIQNGNLYEDIYTKILETEALLAETNYAERCDTVERKRIGHLPQSKT